MSQSQMPPPMLTRSSGTSTDHSLTSRDAEAMHDESRKSTLESAAAAAPRDVLDRLRQLVEDGQIGAARRLTQEAVRRFPDDPSMQLAKRVLAKGEPSPVPYVQPTAAAEYEWLDRPPEEARGKWVALIGSELVAMADSVDELMKLLRSRKLSRFPLVHHLTS